MEKVIVKHGKFGRSKRGNGFLIVDWMEMPLDKLVVGKEYLVTIEEVEQPGEVVQYVPTATPA